VTRTVAAFDFDGTLTRRDSLLPFLYGVVPRVELARTLALETPALARIAVGRGDRDAAKERFLARVLAGRRHDDIVDAGGVYAARLARDEITPEMRARLAWHRREGHDVVIVSASLDVYIVEVARNLGVEHALCTSLEVDHGGLVTGRLLGGNCRGPEKANRLRSHLGDDDVVLWAYGDSSGDAEMLAMADHPMKVRRGRLAGTGG